MRSISLLLFFIANALIAWRLYAMTPLAVWFYCAIFSSVLSFLTALSVSTEEREENELLKRQKESLNSQVEALRVSQRNHSEELQNQIDLEKGKSAVLQRTVEELQGLISLEKTKYDALQASFGQAIELERAKSTLLHEEKELEKARSLSFQGALEEMHEQLKRLQEEVHRESEALQALHVFKHQHLQLRKQFDEKNETLKEVRQQLFDLEGRYLILQRESSEKVLECEQDAANSAEISALSSEEHRAFEVQVKELEEIISHLSAPKKRAPRKKKNPIETMLELQF